MRIATHYCINCGAEYTHQYSGSWDAIDTPQEYRDDKYCPECKQAIVEALSPIKKKTEIKWIITDEVTLEQLKSWKLRREEEHKNNKNNIFPLARRVFPSVYNTETNEHELRDEVMGMDDNRGRVYHYSYFPSKPEDVRITVKIRVNVDTGKIVRYES